MKTLLLVLTLTTTVFAQGYVFEQGQHVAVRVHHRWRIATMCDNPRYNDPWTQVCWRGKLLTVALVNVRKVRR